LQVAPEDCTGCALCVEVCPVESKTVAQHKALNMMPQAPVRARERANWQFFLDLPEHRDPRLSGGAVKRTQLLQPLFEFSGACAGCGETPYLRLLTQLFGDRALIANATGCSSIYGGNLPTTPYKINRDGRGPAWANSLFEDNAEFGLGIRLAIDPQRRQAEALVRTLAPTIGDELSLALLGADQSSESGVSAQRARGTAGGPPRSGANGRSPRSACAREFADSEKRLDRRRRRLGLRHRFWWSRSRACFRGERQAARPRYRGLLEYRRTAIEIDSPGAVARFAAGGKTTAKKDLALMAMSYGNVYVARVALGANDTQTVQAFEEAEAFNGPALILAYGACVAHGYDLAHSLTQQRLAVRTAYWPLLRYNPARLAAGDNPLSLDSQAPNAPLSAYLCNELRFNRLTSTPDGDPGEMLHLAEKDVADRWHLYSQLASLRARSASSTLPATEPHT
jgi:pyruvate-ferredoxin/flavodoxin oxidoreductase